MPSRELTEKEFDEYLIRSNQNGGEFDFNLLEEYFEADDLLEFGFNEEDLNFSMEADFEEETPLDNEVDEDIKEVIVEVSCVDEIEAESVYKELISRGMKCKMGN